MAIKIPGSAFQGISSLGASAPDAGYYAVSLVEISVGPNDKPGTRRIHVLFENGFKMFTFQSLPYDDNGNEIPGLSDKQVRGRMAAFRSILESLGYTKENIETAPEINDGWLLHNMNNGRQAYVEFTPGQQGVQGSYNSVEKFISKAQFDALIAAGSAPVTTSAPVEAASIPATMAPPVNGGAVGAPVPSLGVALPPPASAAQGIVG